VKREGKEKYVHVCIERCGKEFRRATTWAYADFM